MKINYKKPDFNKFTLCEYLLFSKERIKNTCNEIENGCWIWLGYKCEPKKIYGLTSLVINGKKKKILAHRAAYFLWKGEIPLGLFVLHSCDTPLCCNPEHLHLGNAQKNMDEMKERGRKKPAKGEKNRHAKLTNEIVLNIRKDFDTGLSVRGIERKYKIASSTASYITRKITWKHI